MEIFFGKIFLSLSLIELSTLKQYQNQYQDIQREEAYAHKCFREFDLSLKRGEFRRDRYVRQL